MGIYRNDYFKSLKIKQDSEAILADCAPILSSHGISNDQSSPHYRISLTRRTTVAITWSIAVVRSAKLRTLVSKLNWQPAAYFHIIFFCPFFNQYNIRTN